MSKSIIASAALRARPLFNFSVRPLSSTSHLIKPRLLQHFDNSSTAAAVFTRLPSTYTRNTSFYHAPFSTTTTSDSTAKQTAPTDANEDRYHWVDAEARQLINAAYKRHKALADNDSSFPPALSAKHLETIGKPYHYAPKTFTDKLAHNLMLTLRGLVHAFFKDRYDHHAVCLETVAAVPGIVASFHRHLRSLRRMKRDHGWITVMQEEAENERMHLLILLKVVQPTALERVMVYSAQALYLSFYSLLYATNAKGAHRLTGYLEEEALRAYTSYLGALEEGKIQNSNAPNIAKQYYHLGDDAKLRDVVLHIRADEAMHRDVNHQLALMIQHGKSDAPILKD